MANEDLMIGNTFCASGWLKGNPQQRPDGSVHFWLWCIQDHPECPVHCVSVGKTAEAVLKFKKDGDEVTISRGGLGFYRDQERGTEELVVIARSVSFGRKAGGIPIRDRWS